LVEKVKASGGEVVTEEMTNPDLGYFTFCKDHKGVLFGLIQSDIAAK
jgi:predicted enzyme related to lactoylglutathione lyase